MIHKFKKKVTLLLIVIFGLALFGILLALNISNHLYNYTEMKKVLNIQGHIVESDEEDQENKVIQEGPIDSSTSETVNSSGEMDSEDAKMSQIFSVRIEKDGTFTSLLTARDSTIEESKVKKLAQAMNAKGKESGIYENFQYLISNENTDTLISFIDISEQQQQERLMLLYSGMLGTIGMLFFTVVSVFLSKWLILPMEESFEKQKQFISSAGHELKTPLTVMKASIEMLKSDFPENKYLNYLMDENTKMTLLVHELLTLSQLEQSQETILMERINLGKTLEGACLPFEVLAYEKGITLKLELEEQIFVLGDKKKIQQMIGILLDNGLKHSIRPGTVLVILSQKNGKAFIKVKNQGNPIPEEEQEKIFERFYRLDKSRNRNEGRYGLGLSIAQNIAHLHKSKIQVQCKNQWTTFYLKLEMIKTK